MDSGREAPSLTATLRSVPQSEKDGDGEDADRQQGDSSHRDEISDSDEDSATPIVDFAQLAKALFDAVRQNATSTVLDLLENSAPLHHSENDWTTLHWAAHHGNDEVVRVLVSAGADRLYKQKREDLIRAHGSAARLRINSPLHRAAAIGHVETIWALLLAQLSPDDLDRAGNTALQLACAGGHMEAVKSLASAGFDIDHVNTLQNTLLGVSTDVRVRALLRKARGQENCSMCNRAYMPGERRYMCTSSGDFFCANCSVPEKQVVNADGNVVRPCRFSKRAMAAVRASEQRALKQLELLDSAVPIDPSELARAARVIEEVGGSAAILQEAKQREAMLRAEQSLRTRIDGVQAMRPLKKLSVTTLLIDAIREAQQVGAPSTVIAQAGALLRACQAEAKLGVAFSAIEALQDIGPQHERLVIQVEELTGALEKVDGSSPLVEQCRAHTRMLRARALLKSSMQQHTVNAAEDGTVIGILLPDGTELPNLLMALRLQVARMHHALDLSHEAGTAAQPLHQAAAEMLTSLEKQLRNAEAAEVERLVKEEEERLAKQTKKGKKK